MAAGSSSIGKALQKRKAVQRREPSVVANPLGYQVSDNFGMLHRANLVLFKHHESHETYPELEENVGGADSDENV